MLNNTIKLTPFVFVIFLLFGFESSTVEGILSKGPFELEEISNVPYYDEKSPLNSELTQLNLIIPKGVESPPVLLWIGGGAWAYVNRHQEMNLCRQLARKGILMVSVGHRLSPGLLSEPVRKEGIRHPEHVKDVAQAFKWVYQHAKKYGYSTENIFVGGFSSGAHLSALLASDPRYLEYHGLSTKDINAIIPVGGAYDIVHYRDLLIQEDASYLKKHIHAVFGESEADQMDASPMTYLDQFDTPMLLVSEGDTYQYNVYFEQALNDNGYKNYVSLNCHDETHTSLWKKLSNQEQYIYRDYIVDYIVSKQRN